MSANPVTTPAPLARPTLLPGLRRIWRSRHRLQLGADPARAVVLELADPRTAHVLDLLDGTRSERTVIVQACRAGVGGGDVRALLASLREAGLVVGAQSLMPHNLPTALRRRLVAEAAALALRGTDAPAAPAQILRRRAAARIVLLGDGPLASPIAVALGQAGVGHIAPLPRTHGQREPVTAELHRLAPGTRTQPLRRRDATFAVQVGATEPAALAAAGYAGRRLPHLPVQLRDGAAIVGPLVAPAGMPCLNCVDLHRRDRDPDWAVVAAQLASPAPQEPCATATVWTAAGIAAGEALTWIDGAQPATLGTSVEISAGGQLRRRSWPPHPDCGCVRRNRRVPGIADSTSA